jgi:hypothetical protein
MTIRRRLAEFIARDDMRSYDFAVFDHEFNHTGVCSRDCEMLRYTETLRTKIMARTGVDPSYRPLLTPDLPEW